MQTVGTFRIGGTAAGSRVSAAVTVNAATGSNEPANTNPTAPQTISPTGDEGVPPAAIGLTAIGGFMALAGGIALVLRSLRRGRRTM